jgi:hypothetical protein
MFVPIELFTLAGGAAVQLFEKGVIKMTADLDDAAAKPDAPRSFSLRFTVTPILDTGTAKFTVELLPFKEAPSRAAVIGVQMDRSSGQMVLKEAQQTSVEMPDNVTSIKENRDE